MLVNDLEKLLENENYNDLILILGKKEQLSNDQKLFLGIAFYKTNEFQKAEELFEGLNESSPTNELMTYLIICKIKLEKLFEAIKLYELLCKSQKNTLVNFIKEKNYEEALSLTLFLKSIPLELPKVESKSTDLMELVNILDLTNLSLALAEKCQPVKS